MNIFKSLSDVISQGAKVMFALGTVLIIVGVVYFVTNKNPHFLIWGIGFVGGAVFCLLYDWLLRIYQVHSMREVVDPCLVIPQPKRKTIQVEGQTIYSEAEKEELRRKAIAAKDFVNSYPAPQHLKEIEIARLNAFLREIPEDGKLNNATWMS